MLVSPVEQGLVQGAVASMSKAGQGHAPWAGKGLLQLALKGNVGHQQPCSW